MAVYAADSFREGLVEAVPWQPGEMGGSTRNAVRRPNAVDAPFFVLTAGRSRTAWMSAFLTYGSVQCYNEVAATFRSIEDAAKFFAHGGVGSAETGLAPGWQLIRHFLPEVRLVVVLRDVDDVVSSFARYEISKIAAVDEDRLRKIVSYNDRCLAKISEQPNVLTVRFEELVREDVCKKVFEFCLPYIFDSNWWRKMSKKNVQADAAAIVSYYQRHFSEVSSFKRKAKRTLVSLTRSLTLGEN